jgi:hypothetical protein
MAKKSKKAKKSLKKDIKITQKQLIKLLKKVNRLMSLEVKGPRGGLHLTSKKDKERKIKNTVNPINYGD